MQRYACIDKDGNILWADRRFAEKPADPVGKGWRIVPVIEEKPEFAPETQKLASASIHVRDGEVVEVWQVEDLPPPPPPFPNVLQIIADLTARVDALEGKSKERGNDAAR
jgi:hypothetical protein